MEKPPSLLELETAIREQTAHAETDVLDAMQGMLNHFLPGFRIIGYLDRTEENRREQVWLSLTSRAFNSLRWSFELLSAGYYQQADMLTRSAWEDWLCCEDSKSQSKTVDALLDGKGEISVPKFKEMSDRLPEFLKTEWQHNWVEGEQIPGTYGTLSATSHPSRFSVATTMTEAGELRVGPAYDEDLFLLTSSSLLRGMIRNLDILNFLVQRVSPDWTKEANVVANKAAARVKEIHNRMAVLNDEAGQGD